ncbi:MAG TPA: methyltransferase domain-containing protein, partial [Anaerolineales bacterium]|nr:methyltransferase domain-containing protein [Anaerolineales bacterium]
MTEPTSNPGYVDPKYLQQLGEYVRPLKEHSYSLMNIQQGHKILDVGCGPATDTINFAKMVGERGQVIGIDYDPEMIQQAEQNTKEAGVDAWLKHEHVKAPP